MTADELGADTDVASKVKGAPRKKILIVDDDPHVRISLGKVLQEEGYETVLAADGREAIEEYNAKQIDLVLLDLNLPVSSGWDTFGTLTAMDPVLPIILITGMENQAELAADAGVSALMEKPLNVSLLLLTIDDLLAEAPEMRLKRLVGLHNDLRHVPPSLRVLSNFDEARQARETSKPKPRLARRRRVAN